ncbi:MULTISPECIES: cytochrome c oxidase accessory protein CcoG [unclassified Massilia]|uniref:cytochrome c oxidase accessory protein CcoG n=1 Tax=unclassified Massilia TaxID=2609279 RepID=UPI001B839A90|nr:MULTISPECIES: cytochrome c oxidase accessory protein CcoG [unclassified Massilia]MBQ5939439.1 cytochrome c oxidase accessory protein CcoG [Massilia sp. AB1]MBQ5962098.1 cytochrome c oxidase accessory protein CcoG [Massilia sp. ZL223]
MNAPQEAVIHMYAAREEIYPREIKGRYASLRWACVWLTQLLFYGLPWLNMHGRQAVLFDLASRKFYLFGIVFWPQDFIYLAALLIICAYGLFLVTAVAGRVWCGFACPQTVYTEIFLWIERKIEGARSARIRLDRQPWTLEKIGKKGAKHLAWGAVALWTGFTFVGYFTPVRELSFDVLGFTLGPWETFWVLFYGFATYGNAGWLREQVCKYMCPYARFQSAMFDKDTLIVTYDAARGEPRNVRPKAQGAGDCIDCSMCVQVCPTGIDIRKGLQYECIGCAACVDACNSVMDKIAKPRGLIRYATENGLAHKLNPAAIRNRMLRPRVLVYTGVLAALVIGMAASIALRNPLKLDVIRDRGSMGREVDDGMIENVYRLQVMNTSEQAQRLHIGVAGIPSVSVAGEEVVEIDAASTRAVPVRVRIEPGAARPGSNRIDFTVSSVADPHLAVSEDAVFIVPK